MKTYCPLLILLFLTCQVFSQEDQYPVPEETPTRLFYIQHSNNTNTYVYDANMINDSINKDKPIDEYRIMFAEQGQKKPLTEMQKIMAYGLTITYKSPNLYEMYLAANKDKLLYLTLDTNLKPVVYTTINNKKMYLDKLFVKLEEGHSEFDPDVEYLLFVGRDYTTNENLSEKYIAPN